MVDIPNEVKLRVREELGTEGLDVLTNLAEMGKATDTDLAELLGTRTSTIRRALYGMYEQRVADYAEHRDPATGWLTFVWKYTPEQAMRALDDARRKAADQVREEIAALEGNEFFACPAGHTRMDFATAMDWRFCCPDCGGEMAAEDKGARLANLEAQLAALEESEA